jgi:multimeric flavodoxin WrbA
MGITEGKTMPALDYGILIGSPTYFASCSTEVKALIDRCGFVSIANDRMLSRKVGAALLPFEGKEPRRCSIRSICSFL